MNELAAIGHNQPPPDPASIKSEYSDLILEVENWLDGYAVETEDQMKSVDALLKGVKDAEKEAKAAKETAYRPHKEAGDAVVAEWKPLLDDFGRMKSGLTTIVGKFKTRLAAEKAAEARRLRDEADNKAREAGAAKNQADMGNIEERREADDLAARAREMERAAQAVEKVTGLRTFTVPGIVDPKACINWIVRNDKPAVMEFMEGYVARAVREGRRDIDGVIIRKEKRAV